MLRALSVFIPRFAVPPVHPSVRSGVRGRRTAAAALAVAMLAVAGFAPVPRATAGDAGETAPAEEVDTAPRRIVRYSINDYPELHKAGRLMVDFTVDTPMFKNPRKDFFAKALDGDALRKFYQVRTESDRYPYRRPHADSADNDVQYNLDDMKAKALVFVPKEFEEEKGEGWGVFLFFQPYGDSMPNILSARHAVFTKHKLVFAMLRDFETVADSIYGRYNDLRVIALTLDILASLRKEFPALDETAAKSRVFVGGCGRHAARKAGLCAINFPDYVRGLLYVNNVAVPRLLTRKHFGGENNYEFRRDDMLFLSPKDFKKAAKKVRVAGIYFGRQSAGHKFMYHALYDYQSKDLGFRTRFFDVAGDSDDSESSSYYGYTYSSYSGYITPPAEALDQALAFLGGEKIKQPEVRVGGNYVKDWKWK